MGNPAYVFTGEEVGTILAAEAARRLNVDIAPPINIEMKTTSNAEDGILEVSVVIRQYNGVPKDG